MRSIARLYKPSQPGLLAVHRSKESRKSSLRLHRLKEDKGTDRRPAAVSRQVWVLS